MEPNVAAICKAKNQVVRCGCRDASLEYQDFLKALKYPAEFLSKLAFVITNSWIGIATLGSCAPA